MKPSSSPLSVLVLRLVLTLAILLGPCPSMNGASMSIAVQPPGLLSPTAGDTIYATLEEPRALPTFRWGPVDGADGYHLQVSSSAAFGADTLLYDEEVVGTSFVPYINNLPDDEDLFWRVRAVEIVSGEKAYSAFSSASLFKKNWFMRQVGRDLVENRPSLNLPADQAVLTTLAGAGKDHLPAFSWEPVPGATHYTIILSPVAQAVTTPTLLDTVAPSYQPLTRLPAGDYHWRVIPKIDYVSQGQWKTAVGRESETRTVTFQYPPTAQPQLVFPASGQTLASTPTFEWSPVADAEYYQFQISTALPFFDSSVKTYATSYTPDKLLKNQVTYYWRVGVVSDTSGTEVWSETRDFVLNGTETAQLLTPVSGYAYTNEPFFRWTPVETAAGYEIEISASQDFTSKVTRQTTNPFWSPEPGYNCPPVAGLSGTQFFWRVFIQDREGNRGAASETSSFTCNETAGAPVLVFPHYFYELPADSGTNRSENMSTAQPLFLWKRLGVVQPDGVYLPYDGYRVEVYADSQLANKVWSLDTKNMSAIPMDRDRMAPGMYYWRVRPLRFEGSQATETGQWSQVWKIRYDPALLPDPSGIVQLIRPGHGSEWTEMVPPFEWSPVSGATSYQLEISASPDPATFEQADFLILDTNWLPGQPVEYPAFTYTETLPYGTYYWRVRANDGANNDWSTIHRFEVAAQNRYRPQGAPGENVVIVNDALPTGLLDPKDMQDPNFDVDTLSISQVHDTWYFKFDASVYEGDAIEVSRNYVLYIDRDQIEGSGATTGVMSNKIVTIPEHQPEYAIVIPQIRGQLGDPYETRLFTWLQGEHPYEGNWIPQSQPFMEISGAGIQFDSTANRLAFWLPNYALGVTQTGANMAVALFTERVMNNTIVKWPAQDTVPFDPSVRNSSVVTTSGETVLSRFIHVTDRLSPIDAGDAFTSVSETLGTALPVFWHAPVHVPLCSYDWRIGAGSEPSNWQPPVTGHKVSTYAYGGDMLNDQAYVWQARANYRSGADCSQWVSGSWSDPQTIRGSSGAVTGFRTAIEGTQVRLAWNPVQGADHYDLQIDDDRQFGSVDYAVSLETHRHSPTDAPGLIRSGFADGVTYYWRVRPGRAEGTATDGWSEPQPFSVTRPEVTGMYTAQGSVPGVNPTLCWAHVNGARGYQVEIASGLSFETIDQQVTTEHPCYTPPGELKAGTFYWRVRILDAQGQRGGPSAAGTFTRQYGAPVPIGPSGKAGKTPLFSWTPVQGAYLYRLLILDPKDGRVLKGYDTAATSYQPAEALEFGVYQWKVAMYDRVPAPNTNFGPFSPETSVQGAEQLLFIPIVQR